MATVISPQILDEVQQPQLPKRVPWYLWCAVLGVTSVSIGLHWDISWHRSIGRDTFWTPAHMAIYLCGVLAGICFGPSMFFLAQKLTGRRGYLYMSGRM